MVDSRQTWTPTQRLSGVVYLDPMLLRLFRMARGAARDLWTLIPLVALAAAWSTSRHDAEVPEYLWSSPPALLRVLLKWEAEHWFPIVVATLTYLTVLHIGTNVLSRVTQKHPVRFHEPPGSDEKMSRATIGHAIRSVVAGISALIVAITALWGGPGNLATQYLPVLVALVFGYLVRRWRRKTPFRRLWRPTRYGFRPSWRPLVHRGRYGALQWCDLADLIAPFLLTEGDLDKFANARDDLLTLRDPGSAAWCVARAIEYCVELGNLPAAERFLDEAAAVPALAHHHTVLSAKALFWHALGDNKAALQLLRAIRDDLAWRTPQRLRDQVAFLQAVLGGSVPTGMAGAYRRMAWKSRYADLARWAVLEASACLPDLKLTALAGAVAIENASGTVLNEFASGVDNLDLAGMYRAGSDALRLQGACLRGLQLRNAAVTTYLEACDGYLSIRDQDAMAECLLRAAVEASRHGYPHIRHTLDLLRAGLQMLESPRTGLRHSAYRVAMLTKRHELYADVFDVIAERLYLYDPNRAGEICFWLIESQHRNALGNAIRAGGIELTNIVRSRLDELEAEIRVHDEPVTAPPKLLALTSDAVLDDIKRAYAETFTDEAVDLSEVMRALGGNCAILYDATRDSSGWSFRSVVVSPIAGITVHTSRVEPRPADRNRSWQMTSLGVLDALATGKTDKIKTVSDVPLGDPVWTDIAAAVLPPTLIEVLRRHARQQPSPALLVVPDGPIAALPWPGLRLTDGNMLVDHTSVAFTPSLTLLSPPPEPTRPATAAVHINSARLQHTALQLRFWQAKHDGLSVRTSEDHSALRETLEASPRPELAVIATHGYATTHGVADSIALADDSLLTALRALSWPWPPLVVLGSCWTAQVYSARGQEPLGFPVACLLGGAQIVVSASAPIRDETADDVLARLDEDLISGRDILASLHHHVLMLLHKDDTLRNAPPSWWATLASWTVQSPRTPPLGNPSFTTTYDLSGTSPESDQPGASTTTADEQQHIRRLPSVALSERTADTLAHAQSAPDRTCLTTLDFVSAAISVDLVRSADWTAFTVTCGLADLPEPGRPRKEDTEALAELRGAGHRTLVSARFARAVELGALLAAQLNDPQVEPWHVLFGIIADLDSDAGQWLTSGVEPLTQAELIDSLARHLFNLDLPEPGTVGLAPEPDVSIPPFSDPPRTTTERLLTQAAILGFRTSLRRWVTAVIVIAILITSGFIRDMATVRTAAEATAFAGLVTESIRNDDGTITTNIVRLLPSGPASSAGLIAGDTVLAVDGYRVAAPADVATIVHKHHPTDVISVTVVRNGVVRTFTVQLVSVLTGLR